MQLLLTSLRYGATTRKFGGLGLGLAIAQSARFANARQIVEMHGGQIGVESAGEGQGATFIVQLPLAFQSVQLPDSEHSAEATLDLSGIQILVVDDEIDSRDFVAFVLEQAGAIVTRVASGIEALQRIAQSTLDIIVSDIGMPDIDGYMLIREVRARPPEQGGQILAITLICLSGEVDQQQAIAAGFQIHLSKPVEPSEIVTIVARLCGRNKGTKA